MKALRNVLVAGNLVLALATLVAFASPDIDPQTSAIPGLLGLLFPFLLAGNLIFAVIWVIFKSYFALLSLAIIALGFQSIKGYYGFSRGTAPGDGVVRIATLNCHHLLELAPDRRPTVKQMQQLKADLGDPDILCLQETGRAVHFQKELNYETLSLVPGTSNGIYTNFEVINSTSLDLSPEQSLSGLFDLVVRGDTVRLYLLYLASNRITRASEELLEEGSLNKTGTWRAAGNLLRRYARASKRRARQAAKIAAHIKQSPYPVIVCGDLNDVPLSFAVATVRGDLDDTFYKRGRGLGATYGGKIPGLRIDYILVDESIQVSRHDVPRLNVSDHYPVVAEISI